MTYESTPVMACHSTYVGESCQLPAEHLGPHYFENVEAIHDRLSGTRTNWFHINQRVSARHIGDQMIAGTISEVRTAGLFAFTGPLYLVNWDNGLGSSWEHPRVLVESAMSEPAEDDER